MSGGRAVMGMAVVIAMLGSDVAAQSSVERKRKALFSSKTKVLDTRAAQQYNSSIRLQPPKVVTPTKWGSGDDGVLPQYRGRYKGPYVTMARSAARKHGVPEDLFLRLVNQESRFNPNAKSHKGAIGLAQLMPATARELGVNPNDPKQNLEGGAKYLKQQFLAFKSWRLALAAYNAGPGAVKKHGGVPPYRETKNYVKKIWGS